MIFIAEQNTRSAPRVASKRPRVASERGSSQGLLREHRLQPYYTTSATCTLPGLLCRRPVLRTVQKQPEIERIGLSNSSKAQVRRHQLRKAEDSPVTLTRRTSEQPLLQSTMGSYHGPPENQRLADARLGRGWRPPELTSPPMGSIASQPHLSNSAALTHSRLNPEPPVLYDSSTSARNRT
jgi:hypothetical protein